jgi:hypothetical protein
MPQRKRSIGVTFALFGFLSALAVIGLSSGRLKADTPVAAATAATTPASMEIQAMADDFVARHPGVREYHPAGAAARQRFAQTREQCMEACLGPYGDCMRAGHSQAQCNQVIRTCRASC